MARQGDYVLSLDLRVLDHLGIKLYSNAAAVLSEAVANAWDADADKVDIAILDTEIVIVDDGVGMNLDQINNRFLNVGYDKLSREGDKSAKGRPYMGRKGIGKLALFSIANEIEVHTQSGREKHAFRMVAADIRAKIDSGDKYYPEPISHSGPKKGTKVVLRDLKKKRTTRSASALRKRVARRFSIIGRADAQGNTFEVIIDGAPVTDADREDLRAVEFLWEFGEPRISDSGCPNLREKSVLPGDVDSEHPTWKVRGWIGTAEEPSRLRHADAGSLNGIVVLARGRLIQENVLDKLGFSRILVSYLTGQVEADFLAAKDEEDIATSDRQRVVEDDERYSALTDFLRNTLVSIQDKWTDLRNEARGKQALEEIPALNNWVATLPESQRPIARRLLGLIRGLEVPEHDDRAVLFRSGLLAFERLRLREESHLLSGVSDLTAETLLPLLSDLATMEGSLYREIVRVRLDVIKEFQGLVDEDEKERVLQQHLYENLWLLDTGWERASGSERIEQSLKKEYKAFSSTLTDKQSKGRVDIRYRTNAGEHIIVELKRAGRRLHLGELVDQGNKYSVALEKCLKQFGVESPHISIVFVVGKTIYEEDDPGGTERVAKGLAALSARRVHYEELIKNAEAQYDEFLKSAEKIDHLDEILKALNGGGPVSGSKPVESSKKRASKKTTSKRKVGKKKSRKGPAKTTKTKKGAGKKSVSKKRTRGKRRK